MSTLYTSEALVCDGPWDTNSRKYPVFAYLEHHMTDYWDVAEEHGHDDYHIEGFTVTSPHHDRFEPGDKHAATQAGENFYTGAFSKYSHVTHRAVAIEKTDGWDVDVQFDMFANIANSSIKSGSKIKDQNGTEWDVKLPTFIYFDVVRAKTSNPHDLKLRHVRFIMDMSLANGAK